MTPSSRFSNCQHVTHWGTIGMNTNDVLYLHRILSPVHQHLLHTVFHMLLTITHEVGIIIAVLEMKRLRLSAVK